MLSGSSNYSDKYKGQSPKSHFILPFFPSSTVCSQIFLPPNFFRFLGGFNLPLKELRTNCGWRWYNFIYAVSIVEDRWRVYQVQEIPYRNSGERAKKYIITGVKSLQFSLRKGRKNTSWVNLKNPVWRYKMVMQMWREVFWQQEYVDKQKNHFEWWDMNPF